VLTKCQSLLQGALLGRESAKAVLQAELQVKQAVASGVGLLALPGNTGSYESVAKLLFAELAVSAALAARSSAASASGVYIRRLRQSSDAAAALDLSSAALLQRLLEVVQAGMAPGQGANVSPAVLQVSAWAMPAAYATACLPAQPACPTCLPSLPACRAPSEAPARIRPAPTCPARSPAAPMLRRRPPPMLWQPSIKCLPRHPPWNTCRKQWW
jgi:hypothetical protein